MSPEAAWPPGVLLGKQLTQGCFGETSSFPTRSKKRTSSPLPKYCQFHLNRKAPLRFGARLGSIMPVTLAGWNTLQMPLQDVQCQCLQQYMTQTLQRNVVDLTRISEHALSLPPPFYLCLPFIKPSISPPLYQSIKHKTSFKNK